MHKRALGFLLVAALAAPAPAHALKFPRLSVLKAKIMAPLRARQSNASLKLTQQKSADLRSKLGDYGRKALEGYDLSVWGRMELSPDAGRHARFQVHVPDEVAGQGVTLHIEAEASTQVDIKAVGYYTQMEPIKTPYIKQENSLHVSFKPKAGGALTEDMGKALTARVQLARDLTRQSTRQNGSYAFDAGFQKEAPVVRVYEGGSGTSTLYFRNESSWGRGARDGDAFVGHLLDVMSMSKAKFDKVRAKTPTL
jgi:hypothetical protein